MLLTGKHFEGATHEGLSKARQAIEHYFGIMKQKFKFISNRNNLKLFASPVDDYIATAALLTNAHASLYGNQISENFNTAVDRNALETYFAAHAG